LKPEVISMTRVAIATFALSLSACQPRVAPGPLDATYTDVFRVSGLSSGELQVLRRASLNESEWRSILRVAVRGQDGPPIAGRYEVADDAVIFRPAFPPDAGREYVVSIDPSKPPLSRPPGMVEKTIAMPAAAATAPTVVTGLWPAAEIWPENLLRFYIHFSSPMSRTSAAGRVRLEDDTGREVTDAILPMDLDLWNGDLTRYTVFFDPGRVKRGIRPNLELGRAMVAGRRYAIVVDADWRDAHGKPLQSSFRHVFTAAPEETRAIDPAAWRVTPPRAGSREALVVEFPWPLDRAQLDRAIGVARARSAAMAGRIDVDQLDRRWRFTPDEPWTAGEHDLTVLAFLEDPAGNAVGRAFEMKNFLRSESAARQTDMVKVPFIVE
jgi:hypothetical protein